MDIYKGSSFQLQTTSDLCGDLRMRELSNSVLCCSTWPHRDSFMEFKLSPMRKHKVNVLAYANNLAFATSSAEEMSFRLEVFQAGSSFNVAKGYTSMWVSLLSPNPEACDKAGGI